MPRNDRLSTYKTRWTHDGTSGSVIYHATEIVRWTGYRVTLRSGGWETVTTKRKMNQAARQFALRYGVFQRAGVWYVGVLALPLRQRETGNRWAGMDIEFRDGMTFDAITGEVLE